jgi:hypothetical protein
MLPQRCPPNKLLRSDKNSAPGEYSFCCASRLPCPFGKAFAPLS